MNEAEMEMSSHTSAYAKVRMQKTFAVTDAQVDHRDPQAAGNACYKIRQASQKSQRLMQSV